jgi:hypothetical protein
MARVLHSAVDVLKVDVCVSVAEQRTSGDLIPS